MQGGCTCGKIRYRLKRAPIHVHCCHCTWCQRESGAVFALNALIESSEIELLSGKVSYVDVPTASGDGQEFARCPDCAIAIWSHYGTDRRALALLRVGTLDAPDKCPPDIHIYTSTKQPWLPLDPGVPAVPEYYSRSSYWSDEKLARLRAMREAG